MPRIEDLKSNSNQPKKKQPFIPTITEGENEIELTTIPTEHKKSNGDGFISTPKVKDTISMGMGLNKDDRSSRQKMNMSSIPVGEENHGNLHVETRKDVEDKVFGPGGEFEKYVAEKRSEMLNYISEKEKEKAKAEESEELDKDSNEEATDAEDLDTNINYAKELKPVDLSAGRSLNKDIIKDKEEYNMNNEDFTREEYDKEEFLEKEDFEDDEYEEEDEDQYKTEFEKLEEEQQINIPKINTPVTVEEEEWIPMDKAVPEKNTPADAYHNAEEVINGSETEEEEPFEINQKKIEPKKKSISQRLDTITRSYMAYSTDVVDDEEDIDVPTADDEMNSLKALITEKISKVNKKLDISGFVVSKKGTSSNSILASESSAVSKWVLPATGITIQLREISGANLEAIRSHLERTPSDVRSALKIVYDHIVSPKPASLEAWMKSIAFSDYDHIFMAIYIASFSEANYLPVDCTNQQCGKAYLTDNVKIMDMIKFKDNDSEEKFWNLYNSSPVNPNGLYISAIQPISDKFAIAFREPSLYSVLIENQYFNQEFTRKYGLAVDYLPYIEEIYWIDSAHKTLVPINFSEYDNNVAKTARSKAKKYYNIINTMNADENGLISAYINSINERIDWFSYQIPETTCPHCGHVNPALADQSASALVFLRSRLGVLATI